MDVLQALLINVRVEQLEDRAVTRKLLGNPFSAPGVLGACRAGLEGVQFEPWWKREDPRERIALERLQGSPLWRFVKDSPRELKLAAASFLSLRDREDWRMLVSAVVTVTEPDNPAVKRRQDCVDRLKRHRARPLVEGHSENAQLAAHAIVRAGPEAAQALRGVADLVARV